MGVGSCCYKLCAIFVTIISIILFLIGLALGAVGGALLFGNALIKTYVSPILSGLLKGVAISGFSMDANMMVQGLLDFLKPMAVGLFIAGIFLLILGFCGMFGPCCKNKCLLFTFTVLAGIILIAELGLLIYVGTSVDKFTKLAGDYMLGIIQKDFVGIKATNFVSLLVNVVQAMVGCCGVYNGTDYQNATKWDKNFSYTVQGYNLHTTLQYPLTCCKMKNFKPVSVNCSFDPTSDNSNHGMGCLTNIAKLMTQYSSYVTGGIGGLFGLQVGLTVFGALMIIHIMSKHKTKVAAHY